MSPFSSHGDRRQRGSVRDAEHEPDWADGYLAVDARVWTYDREFYGDGIDARKAPSAPRSFDWNLTKGFPPEPAATAVW